MVWHKSNGIDSYSQEIRISKSTPNVIYATTRTNNKSGLLKSIDSGQNFEFILPLVESRDVNSIAISAVSAEKLCVGTYEQGVFCSNDGGITFDNAGWVASNLSSQRVRFVVVDPKNDDVYYAGTGANSDGGIFKTSNFGETWEQIGQQTFSNTNCLNIVVDENDSLRLFAGNNFGIARSLDGGNSWVNLPIPYHADQPATVIDKVFSSTIYSGTEFNGVFISEDNGDHWQSKNSGIETAFVFRLAQDSDNTLYASNRKSPGGVFRSRDRGGSWQNISDPTWSSLSNNIQVWGLDVINHKIIASIDPLGVFFADTSSAQGPSSHKACQNNACVVVAGEGKDSCQTDAECAPPPPPGPKPVVFIPGFGASWSYKGLILRQATTYHDWQLLPRFTDYFYRPLVNTLTGSGLTLNVKFFIFAYDYRKSVADSASWLNDYLSAEVIAKNPNLKANLVGHSMGGVVARYCFEKIAGCSDKINAIITGGSPHQGTLEAYEFWEGGKIAEKDLLTRFAEQLLLQVSGFPRIRSVDIIQKSAPGVKDMLPIFNYIPGKSYSSLSLLAKNPTLESLQPASSSLNAVLVAFSGTNQQTPLSFEVTKPTPVERLFGYWTDGKPKKTTMGNGDQTVLKTSSEVLTAQNRYYSVKHGDYFNNKTTLTDLLSILGLKGTPVMAAGTQPKAFQIIYSTDEIELSAQDVKGNSLGTIADNGKTIFLEQDLPNLRIRVKGKKDVKFKINQLLIKLSEESKIREFSGSVKQGETKQLLTL